MIATPSPILAVTLARRHAYSSGGKASVNPCGAAIRHGTARAAIAASVQFLRASAFNVSRAGRLVLRHPVAIATGHDDRSRCASLC